MIAPTAPKRLPSTLAVLRIPLKMTSSGDSLPARTHPTEKVVADGDESDGEDIFHDARFPAEEEQVN